MSIHEVEILRAAYCVAAIDGHIDADENVLIDRLAHRCGVGQASVKAMRDRARDDAGFYKEQFRYLSTDPDATIRALLEVAAADGRVSDDESTIIAHFARKLDMSDERFHQLLDWRLPLTANEARTA